MTNNCWKVLVMEIKRLDIEAYNKALASDVTKTELETDESLGRTKRESCGYDCTR